MSAHMPLQVIGEAIAVLIPLILSLTVHEFAHAWAAKRLGDDTAERMGRLNLNPLAHADVLGTLLLPLFILVANGASAAQGSAASIPFFGWAKPTPVNAGRFTRRVSVRAGSGLVAAAGPLSNIIMATLCALVLSAATHVPALSPQVMRALSSLMLMMIYMNTGLAIFNLLPLPPLDGATIATAVLPMRAAIAFSHFNRRIGGWLLLVLVFLQQPRQLLQMPMVYTAQSILHWTGVT